MNLELIISPSGLGKTTYILDEIEKNRIENKIIVLTPEQNGYNFEKLLCNKLNGTFDIDVMNFNSLCRRFAQELNFNNNILEDEIKFFYYLDLANNLKNADNFLISRILQDVNFISVIDDIISELKEYNIPVSVLEEYYNTIKSDTHKEKISAILQIYNEYLLILSNNNKYDKYDFLQSIILYIDYIDLSNYIFYIDAYYNFSPIEYVLIEKLILKSKKVVISVTSNIDRYIDSKIAQLIENYDIKNLNYKFLSLEEINNNFEYSLDIFRKSHEIIAYINEIIKRNKIIKFNLLAIHQHNNSNYTVKFNIINSIIKEYKVISIHQNRYINNDLNYLVNEYPKILKSNKTLECDFLNIYEAENIELEIKQAARNIYNLKNKYSMKDEDFAILYRDDSYENFISIFSDYGINVHLDRDLILSNHRLIKLISNILNYNNDDFIGSILNIFKTQLTNFENLYKELLEKYLIFGNIKVTDKEYKKYLKLQKNSIVKSNYRILSIKDVEKILKMKLIKRYEDLSSEYYILETSEYKVFELEIVREILQNIVKKIEKIISAKYADKYITHLNNILNYFNIKMILDRASSEYDNVEDLRIESIDRQVYTKFLNILENIRVNLKNKEINYRDFKDLLLISINKIKYRNIPEMDNFVVMAKMDLAKVENKRVACILGFNKDVLPRKIINENILDDTDKNKLFEAKIILSPTNKDLIIDEEFVSYIALSRVTDKIFISYTKLSNDYKETSPSIYLNTIKNIFYNLDIKKTDEVLKFKINNINSYLENIGNIYSYKEASYLYMKFIQNYKLLRKNSNKNGEELIKELIRSYSNILNNYSSENVIKEKDLNTELTDKISSLEITGDITYNDIFLDNVDFTISENFKKEFIFNNKSFSKYSASKIIDYSNNPYAFFLKRVLKLNDVMDYGINSLNVGNFFHAVMDNSKIKNFILEKSDLIATLYEEDEYEKEISKLAIRELLVEEIMHSDNRDIRDFLILLSGVETNNYIINRIIIRLIKAIEIEIKYMAISGYKFNSTERKFELEFNKDKVIYKLDNKMVEKKLPKEYKISNIKFCGKIDRIDFKNNNYLVIDYKSSNTDFKLKELYNGEISQILCYILALQLILAEKTENIFGAFYREISNGKKDNKEYRLRGLVNKDLLLQEEYSDDVLVTRVTKKGDIHASDIHKAYTSNEIERLIEINIDNLLRIVERINKFDFSISELEELSVMYKLANGDMEVLEKKYENISNKELRSLIFKKKFS